MLVMMAALLAACTGPTDPGVSSAPSDEPTPAPTPPALPHAARPVPEPSPWPIQPDEERDRATTPDVDIGMTRQFRLYTHCGIDFRVDFDGSFWQWYAGKWWAVDDHEKGTMTLLSDDVAVFRFQRAGVDLALYFVRNDAPKPVMSCF
jgi:hypothetical protein